MLRTTVRIASLSATLLLACAALASEPTGPQATSARTAPTRPSAVEGHANAVATSPALLPDARDAGGRVLAFLSDVSSTAAFTPAGIGRAMDVTLNPDPNNDRGWAAYHSPDIGYGWTYWVQFAEGEATMKPGFRFWFAHDDRAANAAPVCALPLDQVRRTLAAHGWSERQLPSELAGIRAIEFTRGDVVLTLTPRDGADVNGTACVLSLQTNDGRPAAPQRSS
ncbi:hypothetical protein L2Y96_12200 [Luteibacter aegosomaticola]|uniref:hypothetical protein n=1 Tax=Luteibacter aegosomaticola TaxID=2911538 RepID=UPI001FFA3692|nr:hypothetical protein [Luteibacter aegosomaticola]UPG88181.1 hypothetical protein L2Y96_12200 [Luteibacter aegosomaticola]